EQFLPVQSVAAAPEGTAGPARRRDVGVELVRRPDDITAARDRVRRVAGRGQREQVVDGTIEVDPRDGGMRRHVADVLTAEERAVRKNDGVDDVAVLIAGDDGLPGGAAVSRPVRAGLRVGIAEEGPKGVAHAIDRETVSVAVTLERIADGPARSTVGARPEPDGCARDREDLVFEEVGDAPELAEAVRRQRSIHSRGENLLPAC